LKQTLKDKVVLITGSSRGIGKSIALEFAHEGAKICVTYNTHKEEAKNVCDTVKQFGGTAYFYKLDVTKQKNIQSVLSKILKKFGTLDILVNNAGFLEQKDFFAITENDWDFMLNTNLKSVFLCSQIFSKYFISKNSGSIINISSIGGQIGGEKAPHYSASKAGVISLTKSLSRLLSPFGIRVNSISPGFIRTEMFSQILKKQKQKEINSKILLSRPGEPSEVAQTAVFLASDASSYITGQTINVNGGIYLS